VHSMDPLARNLDDLRALDRQTRMEIWRASFSTGGLLRIQFGYTHPVSPPTSVAARCWSS
jgi:hypothetical protein